MSQYWMTVGHEPPSMGQDKVPLTSTQYRDAVEECHEAWRRTQRPIGLHANEYCVQAYHRVSADGEALDFNHNSGVPKQTFLEPHADEQIHTPGGMRR